MNKPGHVLTRLEAEPIVFAGCTNSEISAVMRKASLVGVIVGLVASFLIGLVGQRIIFYLFSFFVFFIIATGISGWFLIKTIARKRAGKPLFYDKHLTTFKNRKLFIHPAKSYQLERNNEVPGYKFKKVISHVNESKN